MSNTIQEAVSLTTQLMIYCNLLVTDFTPSGRPRQGAEREASQVL